MNKYFKLIISIGLCFLAGGLGTLFTISAIPNWYQYLNKPFFSPPNWLFGPVWSILYLLMGISLFIIWNKNTKSILIKKHALVLFGTQLFLNAIWTPIFFGLKNLPVALFVIIFMWYFIYQTIKAFAKLDKTASYLLYPYLAWVSFATLLNLSVALLNR
ncbi:tryptophan-rich sensory protein [soil metagenome]